MGVRGEITRKGFHWDATMTACLVVGGAVKRL